ncbi:MAG TPA: hypothetical protein VII45_11705 [Solirubrobacterales bacterium]
MATALYAVISGVWIYGSYKGTGVLHTTTAAICVLALGVGIGAYVRSWWMLLSLVGPLVALGYLEVSGFVGTSDDWAAEPLLSPPGVFVFFMIALILMLGHALGGGVDWVAAVWRRRDGDEESARW